jgi:hypothetical protein
MFEKYYLENHSLKGVPHEINGSFSLQKCWQMFYILGICVGKDVFFNAKKHTAKYVSDATMCMGIIFMYC